MSSSGAINWSDLLNTVGNGCGLYNNTISYIDSGWKVKIRNFSSYECEICPEGDHPDMDSLVSVLVRLQSTYPDIWKAHIHIKDREEYICTIDDRFQIYAPDEVATLAVSLMQVYLKDLWDLAKKRKSLELGEEED